MSAKEQMLQTSKKMLLVVDFINEIVHADGKIPSCAAMVAEGNVMQQANQAMAAARSQQVPVIHVKVAFSSDYIECPAHSPVFSAAKKYRALELGTWGTEFHADMDLQPSDHVMVKHRISAYYATPLAAILDAQQVREVVLTGVSTNMAIETTARELHDRGFIVTVLDDACAAADIEIHRASLKNLARCASVMTVAEWAEKI